MQNFTLSKGFELETSEKGKSLCFLNYTIVCDLLPATIQVSERTFQLLKNIKKEMKARSYNQVIKSLILERKNIPKSMFGSNPQLKSFSQEDKIEL